MSFLADDMVGHLAVYIHASIWYRVMYRSSRSLLHHRQAARCTYNLHDGDALCVCSGQSVDRRELADAVGGHESAYSRLGNVASG